MHSPQDASGATYALVGYSLWSCHVYQPRTMLFSVESTRPIALPASEYESPVRAGRHTPAVPLAQLVYEPPMCGWHLAAAPRLGGHRSSLLSLRLLGIVSAPYMCGHNPAHACLAQPYTAPTHSCQCPQCLRNNMYLRFS